MFLSYQLLRIQLVRGPGWKNLLHYQTLIGTKCTKCCNQNDNPATGQRQKKNLSPTIVLWWYFPVIFSALKFWNLTVCHFTKNTFLPSEANSPSVPSLYCWLGEDQVIVFLSPPPLWTHRHSEYVEKVHVKIFTFSSGFMWTVEKGETSKTGISLHLEMLLFETDLQFSVCF